MSINPAFFDIFGFFIFALIFVIGYRIKKREKRYSKILMALGTIGIIVDGYFLIQMMMGEF